MSKPLLPILNKPLLQHTLDQLSELPLDEVIIIVGYMKELIQERFGNEYKGLKLRYHEQREQLGTMHALFEIKDHLKDRFLVLNGDDCYDAKDLSACLNYRHSLLVKEVQNPERFGIVKVEEGSVRQIVEKPQEYIGNLASIGVYMLDKKIFNYPLDKAGYKEYFIPVALNKLAQDYDLIPVPSQEYWLPIGYPWDLLNANEFFIKELHESRMEGKLEEGVHIRGNVHV